MSSRIADELKIQFPWGNIAAKWYGSKDLRPIVLVHGWQDSAGSFDTLIPLLPNEFSYLAIDLPGHGLSDQVPYGISYNLDDAVRLLEEIRLLYKWDKISIIAHSMGAIISFVYASFFPESVDLVVALDTLKPQVL